MSSLFAALLLVSIVGLVWGLIAPHHINRITPGTRELTRKHTGIGFTTLILVCIVLVAITAPAQKPVNVKQASLTTNDQSPNNSSQQTTQAPTVTTEQQTSTQPVPYTTENEDDNNLAKGQTKVAQAGKNGTETLTYQVTYTYGTQTSKTLVSTVVNTKPVSEIVAIGTHVAPGSIPAPTTAPSQSCYPLSDEGSCYEPGEYCRDSDQDTSGVAGDGEPMTCENNDGWRWESS